MLFMGYVKMYVLFSSQIQFGVLDKMTSFNINVVGLPI